MIKKHYILVFLLYLMTFDGDNASSFMQFTIVRGKGEKSRFETVPRMEDLEYPRRDGKLLQILNEKWKNYYTCLKEKEFQEIKPEIRRLLEGQNTEFKCDFCAKPFQNYEEIQWKYKSLSPDINITELEYLDLTAEMVLTSDQTLQIFNAIESFSGLYVCYHGKNILSIYILEVSQNDTTEKVEKIPKNDIFFEKSGHDFYAHYQWTNYTECSVCGNIGRMYKYGTCYISLIPKHEYDIKVLQGSKNLIETNQYSLENPIQTISLSFTKSDNVTSKAEKEKRELEIFEKFENGIPCSSPYLKKIFPEVSKNFTSIKGMIKFCWVPCEEVQIFEVFDVNGRILELANNTAGVYSLYQKLPTVPSGIERRTVVAEFGSNIVILCPGTALTNTPVVWKVNDKIVYPEIINNMSNGRFIVDFVNRIHINRLRLKDGKIYSCWQKGKLIGTVHLNVEKKFKVGFNHHVTLFGIVAIIGTFLMVGSKILIRELKMRKK